MIRAALACAIVASSLGGCSSGGFLVPDARPLPQGGPVIDETLHAEAPLVPRAQRAARSGERGADPVAALRQAERQRFAWQSEDAPAPLVRGRIEALTAARLPRAPAIEPIATGSTELPRR